MNEVTSYLLLLAVFLNYYYFFIYFFFIYFIIIIFFFLQEAAPPSFGGGQGSTKPRVLRGGMSFVSAGVQQGGKDKEKKEIKLSDDEEVDPEMRPMYANSR